MDRIDEYLATASVDKKYSPSIRAAASLGKKTINRYYDLSDRSESYRIAMGKSLYSILLRYTSTNQSYQR